MKVLKSSVYDLAGEFRDLVRLLLRLNFLLDLHFWVRRLRAISVVFSAGLELDFIGMEAYLFDSNFGLIFIHSQIGRHLILLIRVDTSKICE